MSVHIFLGRVRGAWFVAAEKASVRHLVETRKTGEAVDLGREDLIVQKRKVQNDAGEVAQLSLAEEEAVQCFSHVFGHDIQAFFTYLGHRSPPLHPPNLRGRTTNWGSPLLCGVTEII